MKYRDIYPIYESFWTGIWNKSVIEGGPLFRGSVLSKFECIHHDSLKPGKNVTQSVIYELWKWRNPRWPSDNIMHNTQVTVGVSGCQPQRNHDYGVQAGEIL